MPLTDTVLHLLHFAYPALALGTLLAVVGRVFSRNHVSAPVFIGHVAINCIAGTGALAAGLWFFGRDGKMATYGLLVLCVATVHSWTGARSGSRKA